MTAPPKNGEYYQVALDDKDSTRLYVPRTQETSFKEVLEVIMKYGLETYCTKIEISIW